MIIFKILQKPKELFKINLQKQILKKFIKKRLEIIQTNNSNYNLKHFLFINQECRVQIKCRQLINNHCIQI